MCDRSVRRQFRAYGLLNDLFSVLRLDMYGTAAQKQRGSEYSKNLHDRSLRVTSSVYCVKCVMDGDRRIRMRHSMLRVQRGYRIGV